MVQRLEADLGVKVQEVQFPGLQYGFQIWNTYMGLPDKEGNVGSPHEYKAENSYCTEVMDCSTECQNKKGNHHAMISSMSENGMTAACTQESVDAQLHTLLYSFLDAQ